MPKMTTKYQTVPVLSLEVLLSLLSLVTTVLSKRVDMIGCFTCHSFNYSDPGCADPFQPAHVKYEPQCRQGKKETMGLFPASYCIKMSGYSLSSGLNLVVRDCALESMQHQCGVFDFNGERYRGCLTTCEEDGCNHSNSMNTITLLTKILLTQSLLSHILYS